MVLRVREKKRRVKWYLIEVAFEGEALGIEESKKRSSENRTTTATTHAINFPSPFFVA